MHTEFNNDEYDEWVEGIARTNIEADGSSPTFVAQNCIVSAARFDDGVYCHFTASPYTGVRAYPSAILTGCGQYPFPANAPTDLRALAVEILAEDIGTEMAKIESVSPEPAE